MRFVKFLAYLGGMFGILISVGLYIQTAINGTSDLLLWLIIPVSLIGILGVSFAIKQIRNMYSEQEKA